MREQQDRQVMKIKLATEYAVYMVTAKWCLYVISGGDTWASRALSTISSG